MNLTAGTVLHNGKYLINHISDQGGLIIILQATEAQVRPVMLKTFKQELRATPNYSLLKQRFHEQCHRFAGCQHPALVRLIDSFEEEDLPFAVTDYTAGQTLSEVVQSVGVLSETVAVRYVQQIGAALETLHQHGLTHQAVTPDNIIHPPGSDIVVLTNFEIVNLAVLGVGDRSTLPKAGEYAAIEQYQPQVMPTPATDVYGLAGTLYFLLTGQAPVAAPLRSHASLIPPRQLQPHLSPTTESAILRGLEMNPQARPKTISEWLSLLHHPGSNPPELANVLPGATQPLNGKAIAPSNGAAPRTPAPLKHPRTAPGKSSQPTFLTPSKRFSGAIFMTAAIAAAIGIGSGLALRLAASTTGAGASFLHSEQSFPEINGWPGAIAPIASPISQPSPSVAPRRAEDRLFKSPQVVPIAPVVPPPTATAPVPEASPTSPPASTSTQPIAPTPPVSESATPEPIPPKVPTVVEPAPSPASIQPAPPPVVPNSPPKEAAPPAPPL